MISSPKGVRACRPLEGTDLFEQIFHRLVAEIIRHGFLDEESVFIDGTHIKASANNHKYMSEVVEKSVRYYEEELQKEIAADRAAHGKKLLKEKERTRHQGNQGINNGP